MKWIRCIDQMPEIPEGRQSVRVLMAEFDPCYAEIQYLDHGRLSGGYSVTDGIYAIVSERHEMIHGSIYPVGSKTFMSLYIGGDKVTEWGLPGDEVTHWMYIPEAPEYDPEVVNPIFKRFYETARPQTKLIQI